MLRSNLLELLRTFSSKEIKEFNEFIRSTFFNKKESVIKLFDYIRKYYPSFDDKKLEKEYAYEKTFPGTEYNDGFMRTIMFNLTTLAEEYIAYSTFKKQQFGEKTILLSEFLNRGLEKMFEKSMREITEALAKKRVKDVNYYSELCAVEDENLSYLTGIQFEKNEKFIAITGVENIFNNLTYYYLIRILKYYVYALNAKSIYEVEFKTDLVEELLSHFKPKHYQDIPLIKIYFEMVMLHLKEDEEKYFYELKKTISDENYPICEDDFMETFINLENYCKRMMRKGNEKFTKELFEIYKLELRKKVYLINNRIPQKLYRGIVDTGLKLKEFEWVKNFIEEYKHELIPENQENSYNFCLSLYLFATSNFEKALNISSKVKYDDLFQKLELKSLITALYYELNMQEQLYASMDSFRHIISNNPLIKYERKVRYLKFLKYTKRMIKLKNDYSTNEYHKLIRAVDKEQPLMNGEWVLEKLEELKR